MKKEQAATEAALNQFSRNLLLWALISLAMVVLFNLFNQPYSSQQSLAYSDFLAQVDRGEVKDVRIQGHKICWNAMSASRPRLRRSLPLP